jgi:hypothetical protein
MAVPTDPVILAILRLVKSLAVPLNEAAFGSYALICRWWVFEPTEPALIDAEGRRWIWKLVI